MWKLIQIFGSKMLNSCLILEDCGAIIYCPVKKERKRIRSTRGKVVVVDVPAYPGWAFMKRKPDEKLLRFRPFVKYKFIQGSAALFSDYQIEQIKKEEAIWNSEISFQEGRKPFFFGERVSVTGGLFKGNSFVVVEDRGASVLIKSEDENIFSAIKINPFLLERFGA